MPFCITIYILSCFWIVFLYNVYVSFCSLCSYSIHLEVLFWFSFSFIYFWNWFCKLLIMFLCLYIFQAFITYLNVIISHCASQAPPLFPSLSIQISTALLHTSLVISNLLFYCEKTFSIFLKLFNPYPQQSFHFFCLFQSYSYWINSTWSCSRHRQPSFFCIVSDDLQCGFILAVAQKISQVVSFKPVYSFSLFNFIHCLAFFEQELLDMFRMLNIFLYIKIKVHKCKE